MSINSILMVKPKNFMFNVETASSNKFQQQVIEHNPTELFDLVSKECDNFVKILKAHDVEVIVIDDTEYPIKPDAIFPNNWITFHTNFAILYPMAANNRRLERRRDIIDTILSLKPNMNINNTFHITDLSHYENNNQYLEGTGCIIFDHQNKIIYCCISGRMNSDILSEVCELLQYKCILFHACDSNKYPIYHTNVMMCIAKKYTIICTESIQSTQVNTTNTTNTSDSNSNGNSGIKTKIHMFDKTEVIQSFSTNILHVSHYQPKEIIDITLDQVYAFAGNMLEIEQYTDNTENTDNNKKTLLIMSTTAYESLTTYQINQIEQYSHIVPVPIPTIERYGGGSVRCMMCEVR